jgi:hypothetical protein
MRLEAYFDESGLAKADGGLEWLVLGGAIATEEDWTRLSVEWNAALRDFKISSFFHMRCFEHYRHPFDKLTKLEHEALLNRLLDIQSRYVKKIVGVTNWKRNYAGPVRKIYTRNVKDILATLVQVMKALPTEQIAITFAKHPEVSGKTVLNYFDDIKGDNGAFANCVVREPADCPPLQMADFIVYELSHSIRDGRPERYPYRRMKETATVTLFQLMEAGGTGAASGRGKLSTA